MCRKQLQPARLTGLTASSRYEYYISKLWWLPAWWDLCDAAAAAFLVPLLSIQDHRAVSVWQLLPVPSELSQHLQEAAQQHRHLSGDPVTSASPLPSPSPRGGGTNQPYMLLNYLQQQPRTPATTLLPPLGGPSGATTAQSKGLTTGSLTAGLGWEGVWPGSGQAGVRSKTPGGTSGGALSSYRGASGPPSTVKR